MAKLDSGLSVRFHGVAGVRNTEWLDLSPGVSVLTGANNVGKSRLLRLVHELSRAPGDFMERGSIPQVQVSVGEVRVESDMSGGPAPTTYTVHESGTPTAALRWKDSELWDMVANVQKEYAHPAVFQHTVRGWSGFQEVIETIGRLVYVDPQRRIQDDFNTAPLEVPSPNGGDLGNVIYTHRNKSSAEFVKLTEIMSTLFREVGEIRTLPVGENKLQLQVFDRYAQMPVPLNSAGTGVAQLLFFCALVLMSPPGRIFLIDEPHVYLHPRAEKRLAAFIAEHNEHAYVVATHSPILVDALNPNHVWLVTRDDEEGTTVNSVFKGSLSRRHILAELGIEPGDVALYKRVLFVEGKDTEMYPSLLAKLGLDPSLKDCAVLGLSGGDLSQGLQRIVLQLGELMISQHMIYLDGDKRGQGVPDSDRVKYLPYPEIEDLLLRDPAAVLKGFLAIREESARDQPEPWEAQWTPQRIAEFIANRRAERPQEKGSAVMRGLTHAIGPFDYQKTVHGPKIAQFLDPAIVEDLRPQFEQFFT